MDWKPIETAPKDGTWIMLWRGPSEYGTWSPVIFGRWFEFDDGDAAWAWPDDNYDPFTEPGREGADYEIENGSNFEDAVNFTHWMPLPSPPEATP